MPYKDPEQRKRQCRKYYRLHRNERKEYNKKYRKKYKARLKNQNKEWKIVNGEKLVEYRKKYYQRRRKYFKEYRKKYWQLNKNQITKRNKEYRLKHKKELSASRKIYWKMFYSKERNRKKHILNTLQWRKKYFIKYPWRKHLQSIVSRVASKKKPAREYYYDRDIKNMLSEKAIRYLWFRDKAYKMKKPCVHRKDNNSNYSLRNCKFLEFREHSKLHRDQRILAGEQWKLV